MNVDKNILQQASAKIPPKANDTIASLSRGIHRLLDLRDWVTLETVALAPIPVSRLDEWGLISLLSVLYKQEDGAEVYKTPWAVVEWSLKTMTVTKKIDLRTIKANNSLWNSKVIINQPADTSVNLTPQIRTVRENALFAALEDFCNSKSRTDTDFVQLAQHYSGLLPLSFYLYYYDLVPESKNWLLPNIPAIALEVIINQNTKLDRHNTVKVDREAKKLELTRLIPEEETSIETEEKNYLAVQPQNISQLDKIEEANSVSITPQESLTAVILPLDLTEKLSNWFKQCSQIANSLAAENQDLGKDISTLLTNINKRKSLPGFRLAFVGEFSRGKSHLINRLLERNILPEGALPTTATLTSIVANAEEKMEVRIGDTIDIKPLEKLSWDELVATDKAGLDNEVFAGVRLSLDHPWLKSLDIEIIDTPGAGDLNSRRASLVLDVLNQCDAAVLLVSATSPLSMTESAFLEQEVIGRHVPRIMVAVSKLDVIPPAERKQVMQSIKHRIAKISPQILVLPTYSIEVSQLETDILSQITTHIELLVAQGERKIWRSRQVSQQLIDWLSQLITIIENALSAKQMNAEEKKRSLCKAEMEIEKTDLKWDSLQIELEQRKQKWTKTINQKIMASKEELIENLDYEIQKTSDLKTWWERDLSFRLRRELILLSRKSEGLLLKFLAQDIEWIEQEITKLFQTKLKQKVIKPQSETEIDFNLEHCDITNVQKYRLFTRIGTTFTMIAGSVFGGPVGIAASTGLLIASEEYLRKELNTQKQVLSEEMRRIVDTSIDKYCQQVFERLQQLYLEIIQELKNERSTWQLAQKTALQTTYQDNNFSEQKFQQIMNQALTLKEKIVMALNSYLPEKK